MYIVVTSVWFAANTSSDMKSSTPKASRRQQPPLNGLHAAFVTAPALARVMLDQVDANP